MALMVREEDEDAYDTGSEIEPPAHIRNYRNDENILGDPSRVTSWTSTIHEFQHSSLIDTKDGFKIPLLSFEEKKKFLSVRYFLINSHIYSKQIFFRLLKKV